MTASSFLHQFASLVYATYVHRVAVTGKLLMPDLAWTWSLSDHSKFCFPTVRRLAVRQSYAFVFMFV